MIYCANNLLCIIKNGWFDIDMKSLLIMGAGGYGRYIKDLAETLGYGEIEFLDDESPLAIGKLKDINIYKDNFDEVIIAIGNPLIRKHYFNVIQNHAILIHPTAVISKNAKLCNGVIIEANAVIANEVVIKEGTFICAGSVVNHNAIVNQFCQIDCNSVVGSYSVVPEGMKVNSCQFWYNTDNYS